MYTNISWYGPHLTLDSYAFGSMRQLRLKLLMFAFAQLAALWFAMLQNPYKVFIGQLYRGTQQNVLELVMKDLGAPHADAGLFVVTHGMISLTRVLFSYAFCVFVF